VITDLVMPDKEGLETIMELRRKHPAVKIIAMSGGGRINARDFLRVAKVLGADRTFTKPFLSQELIAAIDDLLPGRTNHGPAQADRSGPQ
jgi:DNA-binding response OmpR family regulator